MRRGAEILTVLPGADTHPVVQHQVFVRQLAHHAGRLEERLETGEPHHADICFVMLFNQRFFFQGGREKNVYQ